MKAWNYLMSGWRRLQKYPGVGDKLWAIYNKTRTKSPTFNRFMKYIPQHRLSLELQLVEHCNLNCVGCGHFCSVAEPEFLDINEFVQDFHRLRELFSDYVLQIRLMGGEPLLHPEVDKFMTVARECFPTTEILIVTNGLLLPQMQKSFWDCAREKNIKITPTKYPIKNFDYDEAERLAHEHGVKYRYYGGAYAVKNMSKWPLDPKCEHDVQKEFGSCHMANNCVTLRHGRMYTCPVIPTAYHLNKRFGTNFVETPEDSIDIYKAKSAREIMKFLAHPVPFCRYCAFEEQVDGIPWSQSKRELSEWCI